MTRLTLPFPPSANTLTAVVRGRRVKTEAHRRYKVAVQSAASKAGVMPLKGSVVVCLDVYRPNRRTDLDNAAKAVLDGLSKGVAYMDDRQVVELHMRRFESKDNPRVEVEVSEQIESGSAREYIQRGLEVEANG